MNTMYENNTVLCRTRCVQAVLLLLMILILSGCGSSRSGGSTGKSSSSGGVRGSKPYTIKGKMYYPLASAHGFKERGVASWYGPGFQGKQTANGERYDMHSMTAAHKTLPFGTQVRVINLDTNKSIVVRINDRGPFVDGRVIDLSKTGANRIGMLQSGTARVRIEAIGTSAPTSSPASSAPRQAKPVLANKGSSKGSSGAYYVQVGAFNSVDNARRLARGFQQYGKSARLVPDNNRGSWRLQLGPFQSENHAEQQRSTLQRQYPGAFVLMD